MRQMLAVVAGIALAAPAVAEEGTIRAVEPGMRVRLTAPRSMHLPGLAEIQEGRVETLAGRVLASDAHRILLEAPDGSTLFVPLPGERVQGRLVAQQTESFVVELEKGKAPVRIPRAAVGALEVSAGRSSRAAHALAGLLLGAAVGAGVGALTGTACSPSDWFCSPGFNAAALAILLAPVGAIGGAAMPVERWKPVGEPGVRVGVVPARGGAGIAVAVRF
jgi:hypothetical protein